MIFNDTASDSTSPVSYCICNCTYVSAACCLSDTVHEEATKQLEMEPLPENSPVCCDPNTGFWMPKSSPECVELASNSSGGDFIGLGSVRWNGNGSRPVGFSDDDGDNVGEGNVAP